MRDNRQLIESSTLNCGAERCWVLQSAVAFWVVCLGLAIGCRPAKDSLKKYQAASSSMAPNWFGPHLLATCTQCSQQSPIVREAYDPLIPTRCFSCGAVCVCEDVVHPGDVVEVISLDTKAMLKRFDVVMFDKPETDDEPSPQTLKRVWALPGERVELRDGKAWVDGKQLQKSARELAAVCIPLSRFPVDTRSHWWTFGGGPNSEPTSIETIAEPNQFSLGPSQRLEFRCVRPNRNPETPEMISGPILDDYPFNQNSTAVLREVSDFLLAIELVKPTQAVWSVCLQTQGIRYCVRIGPIATSPAKSYVAEIEGANRLVIAVCDGRLLTATDKRESAWDLHDLENTSSAADEVEESQITITTTGTLQIKRLLVARDQWLGPRESRLTDWTPIGAADGFFVLGDNLQLSVDSRDPVVGRIPRNRIKGKVKQPEDSQEWISSLLDRYFENRHFENRHFENAE